MDIARSFTFITEDEDYIQKLAIGVGVIIISMMLSVVLVGILGFFILAGYGIRLMENVRDGVEKPLPAWDDWGGDLSRGLKYLIVTMVWAIPIFLFTIPIILGGVIADSGGAGEFFGTSILLCGTCLVVLYSIFVAIAQPAFAISFARDERISSGLMLTDIWRWVQENIGQVIIAGLVVIGVSIIVSSLASILGVLICGIGLIVTIPLGTLITTIFQHHLYGQLARTYPMYPVRTRGAAPISPAPAPFTAPPAASTPVESAPTAPTSEPPAAPAPADPSMPEAIEPESISIDTESIDPVTPEIEADEPEWSEPGNDADGQPDDEQPRA